MTKITRQIALAMALLVALQAFAKQTVEMGPILHFRSQDQQKHTWNVSALYLLRPDDSPRPELSFKVGEHVIPVVGRQTAQKFHRDYVIYDMEIPQSAIEQKITYRLAGETEYTFAVPKKNSHARLLYYSCNGYQFAAHKRELGGITPMWNKILANHAESPFHLQLGGGDQIYADGLVVDPGIDIWQPNVDDKRHGVFALPTLLPLFKHKLYVTQALSLEQQNEIEMFYFTHYKRQFNEEALKQALASIPGKYQADDHDYHDGYNSYDMSVQNGPVMKQIGSTAAWHVGITQHGLTEQELRERQDHTSMTVIDDGRLAILGVDTRTLRTANQVVPEYRWEHIFSNLYTLKDSAVTHLLVMLAIPVVYAPSKQADKLMSRVEGNPITKFIAKRAGQMNHLGKVELEDDARDGWAHPAHLKERDLLVERLQQFAEETGIRVTLLGGDVHLGGMGKIYPKFSEMFTDSKKTIYQLISSPVGNMPAGQTAALALGTLAATPQQLQNGSWMSLFTMKEEGTGDIAPHYLMSKRNFGTLQVDDDNALNIRLSVEHNSDREWHTVYALTVPPAA